jgi:hypothetical protein
MQLLQREFTQQGPFMNFYEVSNQMSLLGLRRELKKKLKNVGRTKQTHSTSARNTVCVFTVFFRLF